jgi:hypothetical protein
VPDVPDVPDAPASAPPIPPASLLSTALIDPHAAAHTAGSRQATRVSSASRFVITKPTVEDRQPFIVRAGADLNAQIATMGGAVGPGSQVPDPAARQLRDDRVPGPLARQLRARRRDQAIAWSGIVKAPPACSPSHRRRRLPRSPPGPRCPSSRHARPRPSPPGRLRPSQRYPSRRRRRRSTLQHRRVAGAVTCCESHGFSFPLDIDKIPERRRSR